MEQPLPSEARQRVSDWLNEGQRLLTQVLAERDVLRDQVDDAEQRCARLEREASTAQGELVAIREKYHELQVRYAETTQSVGKLLSQMTTIVEPMKELAEKMRHLSPD
jgi:chromosome segregation ATPase